MIKYLISIIIVFSITICTFAGDSTNSYTKNTIKISASSLGIYREAISIDYERSLIHNKIMMLNMEATYWKHYEGTGGPYSSLIDSYSITTSINSLVGYSHVFFELDTGIRYSIFQKNYRDEFEPWPPVLNLGLRYQHPRGKGLVFRVFTGFIGIGVSIGKGF